VTLSGTLHDAFARRAAATPDRIAVCCSEEQLSYGELDRRSSRLAERLRTFGLPAESRLGLCGERGVEMIIGVLGILKSGAAYVPIDPCYAVERIRYMVADSGMPLIVATRASAGLTACHVPIVTVSGSEGNPGAATAPAVPVGSDRTLAYVIYTSGSTGRPKGVMVEHRNVLRLFERTRQIFGFDETDVWTLFHSMSFDFSVWEMWGALLTGARLVVVPAAIARAPEHFCGQVDANRVTVLNLTPTAFRHFSEVYLRIGRPTSLRIVVFGGEALSNRLLEPWMSRHGDERPVLINMYGITETTVHVTWRRVTMSQLRERHSVIGVPIEDLQVHLLDDRRRPVAAGVAGRLYVSGPGVARGYLNRPGLTAERFTAHDASEESDARLYDSGDLAARLPTGDLVYLGRADDQIKLRGFRIEPREVEACLEAQAGVAAAVVLVEDVEPDASGLVAYIVSHDGRACEGEAGREIVRALAAKVRRELPGYMWPSEYRLVPSLPMTPNGKIDRHALSGRSRDLTRART
jgi:amino acid adenylation domain-containing protein